jgi:hypothetical protein
MAIRPRALALAFSVLALVVPATAGAAVRTAVVVDARDGWPAATGQPSTPDLGRFEVVYDQAGTLTVTADFFADATALATERAYAWSLRFSLGRRSPIMPGACTAVVQGHARIAAFNNASIANRLAIQGADGYLPFEPTYLHPPAVPGSRLAFTATSPALANRDLHCISVAVAAREYGPDEDQSSTYDEACDCWFVGVTDDSVPLAWFPGLGPAPTAGPGTRGPSPSPVDARRASSVRVSIRAQSCGVVAGLRSLAPIGRPGDETPRWGAFIVRVEGPVRRTARAPLTGRSLSRGLATATISGLKAGAYKVTAYYAGDARRRPSPPAIRLLRVHC